MVKWLQKTNRRHPADNIITLAFLRTGGKTVDGNNSAADLKYLRLLGEQYPTIEALCAEITRISAKLSLPKGTEHFMSDLHGEYEAFCHIMNN